MVVSAAIPPELLPIDTVALPVEDPSGVPLVPDVPVPDSLPIPVDSVPIPSVEGLPADVAVSGGMGGGGGAGRPRFSPQVRDVTEFSPELQAQTEAAIARLLEGGALPGLDLRESLIRAESANALRDARLRAADAAAGRGLLGSGASEQAAARLEQGFARNLLESLQGAREDAARFGLAQTQTGLAASAQQRQLQQAADEIGIRRDLGISDQQLRDLISRRQASVQRYAIQSQERISNNELALRRDALEQEILEQNRRFGLDTTQQEIDKALSESGLANDRERIRVQEEDALRRAGLEGRRIDVTEALGMREAERLELAAERDAALQEFLQTLTLAQLPGFPPSPTGGLSSEELARLIGANLNISPEIFRGFESL
ncbi:MAG: hypothetical protein ACE5NA_00060 [Nitrospiraceae bacterium]